MNKAFVRETDAPPPKCDCGSPGVQVTLKTVEAAVTPGTSIEFSSEVFYCPRASCGVAYYDGWGASLPVDTLRVRPYPKDPEGPVCACLSITAGAIVAEAGEGRKDSVMKILKHLESDPDCAERRPDGRTCEREIRRLFLENRVAP